MTDQQAEQKLADRIWRLSHLYKIKTKDRRLRTMKPNKAQLTYLANESDRDIILKARQLGFSTFKLIEQLDYAITTPNVNVAVIAHEKHKVQTLFEIIRLAYENMPAELKPAAGYDNRNEITFPTLHSKIYVALDTRGETVHNLHVSEIAYVERADEKMLGILESVPKDGIISFESTANGMSGYFYEVWNEEKSEFRKHFYNWTLDSDYVEPTSSTIEKLAQEYKPLQVQYNLIPDVHIKYSLTPEQFQWYISKVRRHKDKVVQEYPTNEMEAFVASGRNVFSISSLQRHEASEPIERKYDDLLIYHKPLAGFRYVIGCDPAEGIGEDNSVISVFNAYTGEQCAEFATSLVPPDILAGYLLEIAKYYNNGFIVLEINNHGLSVMDRIKLKTYNIYRREVFDKTSGRNKEVLGWKTSQITKPILVDALEEATRNGDISIKSKALLSEMKTFVRSEEQGKQGFGAEGTFKDDRVTAAGLALQGIRHLPKMRRPKTGAEQRLEEYIAKKKLETDYPESRNWSPRQKKQYGIRGINR